jgi:hypothetical protein
VSFKDCWSYAAAYIPVSLTGITVVSTTLNFELITSSSLYNENDGITIDDRLDNECLLFDITPKDLHDFITSGSFLGTVFDKLNIKLPPWLQFSKSGVGMISVTDLYVNNRAKVVPIKGWWKVKHSSIYTKGHVCSKPKYIVQPIIKHWCTSTILKSANMSSKN